MRKYSDRSTEYTLTADRRTPPNKLSVQMCLWIKFKKMLYTILLHWKGKSLRSFNSVKENEKHWKGKSQRSFNSVKENVLNNQ